MSTKKIDINKSRLSALKKVGILKNVDARKPLTDSQKKSIRNQWKKYHEIATAPKSLYQKQDIKNFSQKEKRLLEKSGYKIISDKIYIPLQGYDKAKVNRRSAYWSGVGAIEIERHKGDRKTETEYIGTGKQKAEWRDKLLEEYTHGKFGKDDWIGIKLYENGTFRSAMYQSIDDVFKYLADDFTPNEPGATPKKELLNNIHLVRMTVRDIAGLEANRKDHKQRGRESYYRKKNSKNTGTKKLLGKIKRK